MKKISVIIIFLLMVVSECHACGKCVLFVFDRHKDFCLSKCSSKTETQILWMNDSEIPHDCLEYFYMGQICAYQNCIDEVQYRMEHPTCNSKR